VSLGLSPESKKRARFDSPIATTRPRKQYSRSRSRHSRPRRSNRDRDPYDSRHSDSHNSDYPNSDGLDYLRDSDTEPTTRGAHPPLALPPPRFSDAADPDSPQHNTQSPPPPSVKDEEDDSSVEEIVRDIPPPNPSLPRDRPRSFIYDVLLNSDQQGRRKHERIKNKETGRGEDWFQNFLKGVASELTDGDEREPSRRSRRR